MTIIADVWNKQSRVLVGGNYLLLLGAHSMEVAGQGQFLALSVLVFPGSLFMQGWGTTHRRFCVLSFNRGSQFP